MERRLLLALGLSLLVISLWSVLLQKLSPVPSAPQGVIQPNSLDFKDLEKESPPSSAYIYTTEDYQIHFFEEQGAIKEIIFNKYKNYRFFLNEAFSLAMKELLFKLDSSVSEKTPTFLYQDEEKRITKRFIPGYPDYLLGLELGVRNLSGQTLVLDLPLVLGVFNLNLPVQKRGFQEIYLQGKQRDIRISFPRKEIYLPQVSFVGWRDRYFCLIVSLENPPEEYAGFIKKSPAKEFKMGMEIKRIMLKPQQEILFKFRIYLGPQDLKILEKIEPAWSVLVHYGFFDPLTKILLKVLGFFYRIVKNWGIAIVLLSLLIYLVLFPLSLKQMRAIKEMTVLQPKIEELRLLYKDNPQRLHKEMMELYRKYKINPLGGCLPLILQMPVFLALYQGLTRSIALKEGSFLWIKDLSEPDRLFILHTGLPIIGKEINLLPILFIITIFIQQKLSILSTGVGPKEEQRLMSIFFTIFLGIVFYHLPSGLVLYWFINNLLMLIFHLRFRGLR
ncbi:MAG: YidC/Oxa1 family insertase periplasmic-domain containing protein [Candidatus Omnitrophica bacterium]|nr:YidC/Oxa1 family insertase periplasmic-domain containing protein [Candidatus Omnitrophota bacterium]